MKYNNQNIFAKILRGEIFVKKFTKILFYHFMILIPKRKFMLQFTRNYIDLDDFNTNASDDEIVGLMKGITIVSKKLGISSIDGKGYRALANISDYGGQEVPHLHFHLFGGEKVGKMVS